MIDDTASLLDPYVQQDPTKFCTYEEFQTAAETLKQFCTLRAQSVSGQLAGAIPSTSDGQAADSSTLIDASGLELSDLGTSGGGAPEQPGQGGGFAQGDRGGPQERGEREGETVSGAVSTTRYDADRIAVSLLAEAVAPAQNMPGVLWLFAFRPPVYSEQARRPPPEGRQLSCLRHTW